MSPTPPSPPPVRPFMTRIPGRHPEVKVHLNLGQAKNAVSQQVKVWSGLPKDAVTVNGYATYRTGMYLQETIDGIQTGRRKYVTRNCGGEIWKLVGGDWVLLHNIPNGAWTHELPWKTDEYEFWVVDDVWNKED